MRYCRYNLFPCWNYTEFKKWKSHKILVANRGRSSALSVGNNVSHFIRRSIAPLSRVSLVTSAAAHVFRFWFWNWLKFVRRLRNSDCVRLLWLKGIGWQHNEKPCILCSSWYLCWCLFGVVHKTRGAHGGAVGWGTVLQTGRSRVRFIGIFH